MADKKISALTAATTPLAGTEVLPIVQGGSTVKVSIGNVTAGRTVSMSKLEAGLATLGTTVALSGHQLTAEGNGAYLGINCTPAAGFTLVRGYNSSVQRWAVGQQSGGDFDYLELIYGSTRGALLDANGLTVSNNNLIIGTAGKGIDFSANTHAAGMTSELLNWYEEGVFTPNQGGGLVVVGAFSSSGRYVRYGNMITVQVFLQGATSIAWASGAAVLFTNLPFTAKTGFECTGSGHNSNYTTSFSVITAGTNTVFSVEAQGAVANVSITLTYFV
jgi:hypothetical protein